MDRIAAMNPQRGQAEAGEENRQTPETEEEKSRRLEDWGRSLHTALEQIGQAEATIQVAQRIHEERPGSALDIYLQAALADLAKKITYISNVDEGMRSAGLGGAGNIDRDGRVQERVAFQITYQLASQVRGILLALRDPEHLQDLSLRSGGDSEETDRMVALAEAAERDLEAMGGWNALVKMTPSDLWDIKGW